MSHRPLAITLSTLCGVLACGICAAATPDQVDAAIAKGTDYLSRDKNLKAFGNWEDEQKPKNVSRGDSAVGDQWGGKTALCTYALLASGSSANDPQVKGAVDFLRVADMKGFYAIGLRAQVWTYLPVTPQNRDAAVRDFKNLWAGVEKDATKDDCGLYDYTLLNRVRIDLSVSQYGVLGMWACAQLNNEVPAGDPRKNQLNYWHLVETRWRALQDKSGGGWSYNGGGPGTPSMTAAGVATLFITQEYLHARDGITCTGNIRYPELDRGIAYLAKNLPALLAPSAPNQKYALYGIERVGVASGLKYFGDVDWFRAGADFLVRTQNADGSWSGEGYGEDVSTSFALLFLSRGREPVMVNKIKYDLTRPGGEKAEGFWNQRARDVANASRFVGKQMERTLNWQILDLAVAGVDDLHDAPIAYLSGAQTLQLAPEQIAKLKQYVEEGGLLVFNTDCNRRPFSTSVVKLLKTMFPDREPRTLERDSVILKNQQFRASTWKQQPDVKALGNGLREFAIIIDDDAGKSLQTNETTVRNDHFALMADIYQYAIDKTHARVKGRTHVVRIDESIKPTSGIRLARLRLGNPSRTASRPTTSPAAAPAEADDAPGDDNPEPGGWRRMSAILHNAHKTDLIIESRRLGELPLDAYPVAHLTGTAAVTLSPRQLDAIKRYVEGGGLLVVDAAGGNAAFGGSIFTQLAKVFPTLTVDERDLIPITDPLFTAGGLPPPAIAYRLFRGVAGDEVGRSSLHGVRNGAGRWGVVFSADDLSVGLVGNEIDGIRGYTPQAATDLMTRIILYARDAKSDSPRQAPDGDNA